MKKINLLLVVFSSFFFKSYCQNAALLNSLNYKTDFKTMSANKDRSVDYALMLHQLIMETENYKSYLLNYISDVKTKTSDVGLNDDMNKFYSQIVSIDCSVAGSRNRLNDIGNNVQTSVNVYNDRLKKMPSNFFNEGLEYLKNKKYDDAIHSFSQSLLYQQDNPSAYFNRAIAYLYKMDYSSSLVDINKFIEKNNSNPTAFLIRASGERNTKDFIDAIQDYTRAIELGSTLADNYFYRADCKSSMNDEYGAIADYNKAIELNPNYSMSFNNRGWSKFKLKLFKEALVDINRAIELDPNNFVAYDSRQEIEFNTNDFAACLSDCNKAISLNPKMANSFLFRGRAQFKMGKKEEACIDWSQSGQLGKVEAYDYINKYCH